MKTVNTKQLRVAVSEYTKPDNAMAIALFLFDISVFSAAIAGVIFLENIFLRILCSITAGMLISTIFVIGHDAAHNTFTSSKLLNRIIARIAFLPSLHNYGLWLRAHNRIHHQITNVQGFNSWSPYSRQEYESLTTAGKIRERIYRSVPGIAVYYLVERWWKEKFYPFSHIDGKYNSVYFDFALVITFLCVFIGGLVYAGITLPHTSVAELIILAFVVPTTIWNFMIGFTVYQHHTHEGISWARTVEDRDRMGDQEDFTMHVQYPGWYNLLSHNIMEHTAHHVDPRIPCYNLAKAQSVIADILGEDMHAVKFSLSGFLRTMRNCKLYDYENLCWMDFDGNRTTVPLQIKSERKVLRAA
ncbi:MAG: fatty acid desaturase [Gammaproteobacteria bacterium]|nr:fatty acid desaturase [Gammaproteobacteria bacterium]